MSSGMYGALSGALGRMHRLDTISDNLGNAGTAGFKKGQDIFQSVLEETRARSAGQGINFSRLKIGYSDFSQGTIVRTNVPLHMAINGEGFFQVQDAEGNLLYTREGNMRLNPDGTLLTGPGLRVMGEDGRPLVLSGIEITVDERGNIQADGNAAGRLAVYRFDDPAQLVRRSGGQFIAAEGVAPTLSNEAQVLQGHKEQSNVNLMQEVTFMMDSLRAFEACQGALKTYNELAGKANEIGTLG